MSTWMLLIIIAFAMVSAAVVALTLKRKSIRARLNREGFQEFEIVVKGHYVPDIVEVRRGIPVRLYFRRDEDTPCSEQVIFSDFHAGSRLAAYRTTLVSFTP